jgi:hypothetical protein
MITGRKNDDMKLRIEILVIVLLIIIAIALVRLRNKLAGSSPPLNAATQQPASPLEGCLKCHAQIEPMHKFGPTQTLDKLANGKDALGLTCTACHGGNPVATDKAEAHVRPRFPRAWMRDGKFKIPDRAGPLLNRESLEFVRFLNPGDLRVAPKTCGSSECHSSQTSAVGKSMMRHGAMLWGAGALQ